VDGILDGAVYEEPRCLSPRADRACFNEGPRAGRCTRVDGVEELVLDEPGGRFEEWDDTGRRAVATLPSAPRSDGVVLPRYQLVDFEAGWVRQLPPAPTYPGMPVGPGYVIDSGGGVLAGFAPDGVTFLDVGRDARGFLELKQPDEVRPVRGHPRLFTTGTGPPGHPTNAFHLMTAR